MSTYRFDPPRDLTAAEITQALRDMLAKISEADKARVDREMPALSPFLIKNDEAK